MRHILLYSMQMESPVLKTFRKFILRRAKTKKGRKKRSFSCKNIKTANYVDSIRYGPLYKWYFDNPKSVSLISKGSSLTTINVKVKDLLSPVLPFFSKLFFSICHQIALKKKERFLSFCCSLVSQFLIL